jgi:hypothetical protein
MMRDDPQLLLALLSVSVLVAGIMLGMFLEKHLAGRRRDAWREKNAWRARQGKKEFETPASPWKPEPEPEPKLKSSDPADQLRIVMAADFLPQPLLNKSEARVFRELDRYVLDRNDGWQVMAQVSLGEIVSSKDAEAYSCVNSKRVDLLLVDADCQPRHAVEYQGGGHYKGSAAARDAVKKEALRRAGIGYHEVVAGHTTPADLKRLVEKLVDVPTELSAYMPPQQRSSESEGP